MHRLHQLVLAIAGLILVNLACLKSQDIIFPDKIQTTSRPRPRPVQWTTFRTSTTTTAATTTDSPKLTDDTNCERHCVVLDLCPTLYKLLDRPTRQNLKILEFAACGFASTGDPLVWCDDFVCDPLKKGGPSPPSNTRGGGGGAVQFPGRRNQFTNTRTESEYHLPFAPASPTPKIMIPFKFPGTTAASLRSGVASDLNSKDCGLAFPSRISGGENAAKAEFPWIVAISIHSRSGPQIICGGAMISSNWVLTAAHCVADSSHNFRNVSHIRVGAHNISNLREEGAENVGIRRIVLHEGFRERPLVKNDIALIQLEKNLAPSSSVGPICIPKSSGAFYEPGQLATIAGWGSDGRRASYNILQKVHVPLVDGETCRRSFSRVRVRVVPEIQLCAGEPNKDSCKGDSGGPLMADVDGRSVLIGIISYGSTQCDGKLPGVYTKVTSYIQWIREQVDKHSLA